MQYSLCIFANFLFFMESGDYSSALEWYDDLQPAKPDDIWEAGLGVRCALQASEEGLIGAEELESRLCAISRHLSNLQTAGRLFDLAIAETARRPQGVRNFAGYIPFLKESKRAGDPRVYWIAKCEFFRPLQAEAPYLRHFVTFEAGVREARRMFEL